VGGDVSGVPPPPPARDAERSYEGRSGRVRLEVRPDDASVYVDDEFRGTAREARIMKLPPGRHVIELVRPGFATERREVTIVSGESQDVLVELRRPLGPSTITLTDVRGASSDTTERPEESKPAPPGWSAPGPRASSSTPPGF
jgi:hypothetical protein